MSVMYNYKKVCWEDIEMDNTKDTDILQFQIWKAHGHFEQPDKTILEDMTLLIMTSVEKGKFDTIVAMGLFKEKNENYKLWERLDIDIDECYLAGDCLYSTMPKSIQGNTPLYEITDDKIKEKVKNLFNRNFDE